jgi:hypothetical protein
VVHLKIASRESAAEVDVDGKKVTLTNLEKVFWPEGAITKRDLLQTTPTFHRFCCLIWSIARW